MKWILISIWESLQIKWLMRFVKDSKVTHLIQRKKAVLQKKEPVLLRNWNKSRRNSMQISIKLEPVFKREKHWNLTQGSHLLRKNKWKKVILRALENWVLEKLHLAWSLKRTRSLLRTISRTVQLSCSCSLLLHKWVMRYLHWTILISSRRHQASLLKERIREKDLELSKQIRLWIKIKQEEIRVKVTGLKSHSKKQKKVSW